MNTICKDALRITGTYVPKDFCLKTISKLFSEIAETLPNKFGICLFCGSIEDVKELIYFKNPCDGEGYDCFTCFLNFGIVSKK